MDKVFNLKSYFYELPESLIAQYPLKNRDMCKLMIVNRERKTITHDYFKNLNTYLPTKTNFLINNSKVIAARLLGIKDDTKGQVEVFLLKQLEDENCFEALLKPLKKIKVGQVLSFPNGLKAQLIDKENRIVKFNRKNVLNLLEKSGHMPLPPYIKRNDTDADKQDYQTVYAKKLGSVAAPTAGLHFTNQLITNLKKAGHRFYQSTLHVGYGTFKPVETNDIRDHQIHYEYFEISKSIKEKLETSRLKGEKICAVGTTSCRVLESIAQKNLLKGETNLFVYPGFSFRMTDHLITNFHLPHSSLLMLVCAFGGYDLMMKAYQEAIAHKYRFYSYGDAMLIL